MWNTVITKDPAYVCRTNDAHFFFFFTVVFSPLQTPLAYIWKWRDLCVSQAATPNLKQLHYTLWFTVEPLMQLLTLLFGHHLQRGILLYLGNKPPNPQCKGCSEHIGERKECFGGEKTGFSCKIPAAGWLLCSHLFSQPDTCRSVTAPHSWNSSRSCVANVVESVETQFRCSRVVLRGKLTWDWDNG